MIDRVLHLTSDRVPLQGRQLELCRRNETVLGFSLKVWSDEDNLDLARRVIPQHLTAFGALPHGVMRADVARLLYLYDQGGWYADTDYLWARDPQDLVDGASIVLPVSREHDDGTPALLGNAVMASVPGHPFWLDVIDHIFGIDGIDTTGKEAVEAHTGPGAITDGWQRFSFAEGDPLLPARQHFHSPDLAGTDDADLPRDVYGYHLVAGTWRPASHRLRSRVSRIARGRRTG